MTGEDQEITEQEMKQDLKNLLLQAYEDGVDIKGGWGCRNRDGHPDWDVVITEVTKKDSSD